jgi:hypothetical protein
MAKAMTVETFAAKLEALGELVRAGELAELDEDRPYLVEALVEAVNDVLSWHRANEAAPLVWCDICKALRGRKHICK